jgi:hypothetical protein
MLGKKIKFILPKVPGKNFVKGKFVILEPANPSKHSKDLFETFSLDKQGLLWKYMPDGPFKNINQLKHYIENTDCFFMPFIRKDIKNIVGLHLT